jgi:hypothetical protein
VEVLPFLILRLPQYYGCFITFLVRHLEGKVLCLHSELNLYQHSVLNGSAPEFSFELDSAQFLPVSGLKHNSALWMCLYSAGDSTVY